MSDRLEEIVVRLIKTYDATAFDTWGKPITWTEAIEALQSYIDTKVIEGRLEEAMLFKQYFRGRTQAYANTRIEILEAELKLKGEKE